MDKFQQKDVPIMKRRLVWGVFLSIAVFILAIFLLFSNEKKRLDIEYESIITETLNTHTEQKAQVIQQTVKRATKALEIVKMTIEKSGLQDPVAFLQQRNLINPAIIVNFQTMTELETSGYGELTNTLNQIPALLDGETIVSDVFFDEASGDYLIAVMMPRLADDPGIFYAQVNIGNMVSNQYKTVTYKDVQSTLISSDGEVLFNTFGSGQGGNFFDSLQDLGLLEEDISNIRQMIEAEEVVESRTFIRHKEPYFVTSVPINISGWQLVSFVRGPDVLFRSASIFEEIVRISLSAILITLTISGGFFLLLLFNHKKLDEEQGRNQRLNSRLQAIFEQHSVLSMIIDYQTKKILEVNEATAQFFDLDRTEIIGESIYKFNRLAPQILEEQFNKLASEKIKFLAAPHQLANGEIKLLDIYFSLIDDVEDAHIYAVLFDSTDREKYRNEMYKEKELFKTTLQSIGEGVVTTDSQGIITGLNIVAANLSGWKIDEVVGKKFQTVFQFSDDQNHKLLKNPVCKVIESDEVLELANIELIQPNGKNISVANTFAPITAENGEKHGVVMIFRDISEEKENQRRIKYLSYHDTLTGLYNRRYLEEQLTKVSNIRQACSVIMTDVNGLKITNDIFGHDLGDKLLVKVANIFRECSSEEDIIARWGGDEFIILMPEKSLAEAESLIKKIKTIDLITDESNLPLSLSLGCAYADGEVVTISEALQQAEKHMYQQKLLQGKSFRNSIINTLLAMLYEKSTETEEHCKRLEAYCVAIGQKMNLTTKDLDELSLLALLHDIGKVAIPPSILKKPGPLTPAEWEEMRRHPEIGYRIAQESTELASISNLILSHHERWDGKGYPRGLVGEDIPLACRIISVVDAFDAMTNNRVYRKAMSVEEAITEIKKNAGTQFDPKIVEVFLEILKEN